MVGLDHNFYRPLMLKKLERHKGLSKIGDAITNLIYSITKSIVMEKLEARNVSWTILSNALKNADLRGCVNYVPILMIWPIPRSLHRVYVLP